MPKVLVDAYILVSLFAPMLLTVCVAHGVMPVQTSVLQMDGRWQALFLAALVMPIFGIRRVRALTTRYPASAN